MTTRMILTAIVCVSMVGMVGADVATRPQATQPAARLIELPKPHTEGGMSLNEALARRRSIRRFTGDTLTREQTGQLCWAAQGITRDGGRRTAPSAGATYPLRVYVALPEGLFIYHPDKHALEQVLADDLRPAIAKGTSRWLASAGAIFVLCGDISITAARYHERAERYVWQETGHVAQNLHLQAAALGLGSTPVGSYNDASMAELLHLPKGWQVMYIVPVGVVKD